MVKRTGLLLALPAGLFLLVGTVYAGGRFGQHGGHHGFRGGHHGSSGHRGHRGFGHHGFRRHGQRHGRHYSGLRGNRYYGQPYYRHYRTSSYGNHGSPYGYGHHSFAFLAVHLKGTYFTSQAAVEQMRKQGAGAIVNITTVLALRGVTAIPSSAPVAAKGAVNAITRSLAVELAADNIRVNAVAPGIIKTPIHGRTDEQFEELNGMQPLGRVGEVKDIVDAVLYLADAKFVTGVILPVDGDVHAGGA